MLSKFGRIIPANESEEKANLQISVEKVPKMVPGRVKMPVAEYPISLHILQGRLIEDPPR